MKTRTPKVYRSHGAGDEREPGDLGQRERLSDPRVVPGGERGQRRAAGRRRPDRLPLPVTPGRSLTFPIYLDLTICNHLPAAAAVRITLLQENVAWWEASTPRWSPAGGAAAAAFESRRRSRQRRGGAVGGGAASGERRESFSSPERQNDHKECSKLTTLHAAANRPPGGPGEPVRQRSRPAIYPDFSGKTGLFAKCAFPARLLLIHRTRMVQHGWKPAPRREQERTYAACRSRLGWCGGRRHEVARLRQTGRSEYTLPQGDNCHDDLEHFLAGADEALHRRANGQAWFPVGERVSASPDPGRPAEARPGKSWKQNCSKGCVRPPAP